MAKMTKAFKKRLIISIDSKAEKLFLSGVISVNDYQKVLSICQKSMLKIGYSRSDLK
tara:strand:+ start:874 stop:1044 length:171 start_codon:yes stop_codon:yes gene_type:complete